MSMYVHCTTTPGVKSRQLIKVYGTLFSCHRCDRVGFQEVHVSTIHICTYLRLLDKPLLEQCYADLLFIMAKLESVKCITAMNLHMYFGRFLVSLYIVFAQQPFETLLYPFKNHRVYANKMQYLINTRIFHSGTFIMYLSVQ